MEEEEEEEEEEDLNCVNFNCYIPLIISVMIKRLKKYVRSHFAVFE